MNLKPATIAEKRNAHLLRSVVFPAFFSLTLALPLISPASAVVPLPTIEEEDIRQNPDASGDNNNAANGREGHGLLPTENDLSNADAGDTSGIANDGAKAGTLSRAVSAAFPAPLTETDEESWQGSDDETNAPNHQAGSYLQPPASDLSNADAGDTSPAADNGAATHSLVPPASGAAPFATLRQERVWQNLNTLGDGVNVPNHQDGHDLQPQADDFSNVGEEDKEDIGLTFSTRGVTENDGQPVDNTISDETHIIGGNGHSYATAHPPIASTSARSSFSSTESDQDSWRNPDEAENKVNAANGQDGHNLQSFANNDSVAGKGEKGAPGLIIVTRPGTYDGTKQYYDIISKKTRITGGNGGNGGNGHYDANTKLGVGSGGAGGEGGDGIHDKGRLLNDGIVSGGKGGNGGDSYNGFARSGTGGNGGIGAVLDEGAVLANFGTFAGGDAGENGNEYDDDSFRQQPARGGTGVQLSGNSKLLNNFSGKITGGRGHRYSEAAAAIHAKAIKTP